MCSYNNFALEPAEHYNYNQCFVGVMLRLLNDLHPSPGYVQKYRPSVMVFTSQPRVCTEVQTFCYDVRTKQLT